MSNNSIVLKADEDYENFSHIPDLAARIRDNGEPGMINLHNIQKFGRYGKEVPDKASLCNPCGEISLENWELCVSGETRILTQSGSLRIDRCIDKPVKVWNGEKWSRVSPFRTGTNQKLYRVTLSDGSYLDVTSEHRWSVRTSRFKYRETPTKNLKINSKLEHTELTVEDFSGSGTTVNNAYLWGFFTGDGYMNHHKKYNKDYLMVCLYGKKKSLFNNGIIGKAYKEQHPESYTEPFFRVNVHKELGGDISTGRQLRDSSLGLSEHFFTMDSESVGNFIGGWMDADGTINRQGTIESYALDSTSKAKLLDTQFLLRKLGINFCSVKLTVRKGQKLTIVGKNVERKKDMWRLKIPSFECGKLTPYCKLKKVVLVGHRFKRNPAHPNGKLIDTARKQRVLSIEQLEDLHDTFCFTEPIAHKGMFNNVLTHQCNLAESFPPRCENAQVFYKALEYATFYASTVSLLPTHRPETNAVIGRNRRIGVSISGIAQWASGEVPKGWGPMNYTKMTTFLRKGYHIVKDTNVKLAKEAGVPASVRVTTVKPSGSISLLAGVTPGVHYPVSRYAIRRMRIGKDSPLVPSLIAANIPHEDDTYSDNTFVFEFTIDHGEVRPCEEVSPWEQFSLVAMMQRCFADNCVSATIYFDKEKDGPDVEKMLAMYIPILKSVSMLPHAGHGYKQAPYEPITKLEYEKRRDAYTIPDFNKVKGNVPVGSKYCTGDKCML